ncbi:hypothetical protein ACQR1W_17710 [Bradyrhizobium sp. HKCCYLS1011]|uniref:hypothetical protein n=1 Tax=Bradyrhizobium sp. HKCCYLS1011 TaxID=3420733 RepID=UPI003EBE2E30
MHWIDPGSLPEVSGTVEHFVLNPHGEVDGFVMTGANGAILVHTPPHMEDELTRHVRAGDRVHVHGVKPRGADLLAAVAVTAKDGRRVVDQGPDHEREHPHHAHVKMEAQGTVRLSLFGPKGELRGALLTDGTVVRIGPKEAEEVADLLAPSARLAVRGDGIETRFGRVIHAKEVGKAPDALKPLKHGKPDRHGPNHKPGGPGKPKHDPKHDHEHDAHA